MAKFFGTDGVRGLANTGKMTPTTMLRLGQVVGQYFLSKSEGRASAVIGKDTRLSGDMIESALIAGLTSMGIDVKCAGVLPCLLYTSPSPRDLSTSRMPSSA